MIIFTIQGDSVHPLGIGTANVGIYLFPTKSKQRIFCIFVLFPQQGYKY